MRCEDSRCYFDGRCPQVAHIRPVRKYLWFACPSFIFTPRNIRCPLTGQACQTTPPSARGQGTARVPYVAKRASREDSGCPVVFTSFLLESEPLITWRLLLFALLPFLFLLLLRGRLRALRRRRRPSRCGGRRCRSSRCGRRRTLLLLALLRRRRLRPWSRSWLVPVGLGTIVRLRRRRRAIACRWLRTIRLGTSRLRLIVLRSRPVIRRSCGRPIRLLAVIRLIHLGTIIGLRRRRTIRLGAIIRLCRRWLIRLWRRTIVWLCRGRPNHLRAVVRLCRSRLIRLWRRTIVRLCRRRKIRLWAIVRLRRRWLIRLRRRTIVRLRRRGTIHLRAVVRLPWSRLVRLR